MVIVKEKKKEKERKGKERKEKSWGHIEFLNVDYNEDQTKCLVNCSRHNR